MGVLDVGKSTQEVADNLGRRDTTRSLKRPSEAFKVEEGPSLVATWDINTAPNWNLDQWGVAQWDGTLGGRVVERVVNPNGVFLEYLWHDRYVDDGSTDASIDYDIHEATFSSGSVLQSGTIFANNETVKNVRVVLDTSNVTVSDFTYGISVNGGSSWTDVSHNSKTDFGSGTTLHYRITCGTASGTLSIDDSVGLATPIKVFYNE